MSSNDFAIKVENLGKRYQIYNHPQDRLKQSIYPRLQALAGRTPKNYFHEFWALQDVSFEIKKGETIGIVGRNGSGKSTLLQLICGTLTPTNGSVWTDGRLAALLELGSGFNPEFTGRENVYLNGAVLGLAKNEIDARFDDIAAFADIGEFIEQPVKIYSSGMYVRLAFAINIMSQPDIMVVDEALAVGDMNFQAKCITALKRKQEAGMTVLLVSHDINSVKSLCMRGIYLEHGKLKTIGTAAEVSERYIRTMREEMTDEQRRYNSPVPKLAEKRTSRVTVTSSEIAVEFKRSEEFDRRVSQFRYGTGDARITYAELLNMDDMPVTHVEFNQNVKVRIYFEAHRATIVSANFNVMDNKKNQITGSNFSLAGQPFMEVRPGDRYRVDYTIQLPLQEGDYAIQVAITEPVIANQVSNFLDHIDDVVVFTISKWEKAIVWSKVYMFPTVDIKAIQGKDVST